MSLPKPFLEELRVRVPLSDLIGKRVRLVRAGREFKGCCPFHKEKTPSFYVNDVKAFYHCFGCGAHGDSIRFLMEHDNLKFMEAVEQLAGFAGLEVPRPTPEEARAFSRQMSLYDLMEQAARHHERLLHAPENREILSYLSGRGLSMETIRAFRIGFAPADDGGLAAALRKAGFSDEDMIEAGLFRHSERRKGELYPFFRERVMFPVQDFQGRVVAFGGRVLPGAPKDAPKYINSPETPIFHKGRNLYGLSRARKAIGDGAGVVVVEGYMDVIALAQAGFPAAVAPLGTALTESQVETLWKVMPPENRVPVLCFDGDTAGQRAAGRSLGRILTILKPDHTAKFAFLPEEHDPDSLIKAEGRGAMERVLGQAASLFDMLWQEESRGRNFEQPEARAGFKSALLSRARDIADETVREFFVSQINQKVEEVFLTKKSTYSGAAPGTFRRKPQLPTAHSPYRPPALKAKPPRSRKFVREKVLIATMIAYPELYEEFAEQFGMIETDSHDYDQLKRAVISLLDAGNHLDYQAVKTHLTDSGLGGILDSVMDPALYLHAGFARPGQPLEAARQGWADTYDRGQTARRSTQA